MKFTVTTLGTGSALPNKNRFSSAHVVDIRGHLFLIDCGEATQVLMHRAGFSAVKLEAILISHIHGDHIFGIFGLLSTMALQSRLAPLDIFAPMGFKTILDFFMGNFAEGVKFDINFHPITVDSLTEIHKRRNFSIEAFPLNHRIDTYGYIFREAMPQLNIVKWRVEADSLTLKEIGSLKYGESVTRENGEVLDLERYTYLPYTPRAYAYCSDTAPFDELVEWIKGVDLLYHESTYGDDMQKNAAKYFHSTARDAANAAQKAGVKRLLLGHYSSRYLSLEPLLFQAREVFANTELSEDGKCYELELLRSESAF